MLVLHLHLHHRQVLQAVHQHQPVPPVVLRLKRTKRQMLIHFLLGLFPCFTFVSVLFTLILFAVRCLRLVNIQVPFFLGGGPRCCEWLDFIIKFHQLS